MTQPVMPFSHPNLPTGVDAIRVLQFEAGDFFTPLAGKLVPVAFSDKPKYVALSYSWRNSYLDNSELPISSTELGLSVHSPSTSSHHLKDESLPMWHASSTRIETGDSGSIQLNGQPFPITRNLQLALLHIRSPTHSINIWIDAICINQANEKERNEQVSLMAFIYTRAVKVVSWLGTKSYSHTPNLFRFMSLESKGGHAQHLGAALAGASNMRYSPKPEKKTLARILDSGYWVRLWVVQEVCLPRNLVMVYGSDVWEYDALRRWSLLLTKREESYSPQSTPSRSEAALRLLETRGERHSNEMSLERLIEKFAYSGCSESRDKIYGLLGCANDIKPFADQDGEWDALKQHIDLLGSGSNSTFQPRRGLNSLKVNYDISFFDLWVNVVATLYFQVKDPERDFVAEKVVEKWNVGITKKEPPPKLEVRQISIVRTAGIVQKALNQSTEIERLSCKDNPNEYPAIKAVGYIAGEIVQLGPDYASLIGSSSATQEWASCWVDHYHKEEDLEKLRWINEEYTARILNYNGEDVTRIRDLKNANVLAHRCTIVQGDNRTKGSEDTAKHQRLVEDEGRGHQEPRLCLGTGHLIGLVPPSTVVHDIVVGFWNCNAAIVMRPMGPLSPATSFMLVGRADVAEGLNGKLGADPLPLRPSSWEWHPPSTPEEGLQGLGLVIVDLNLQTLQRITAHIST